MKHFSNDHEYCPNQHKNSDKLCNEKGHSILKLKESRWKLRQQHDQNFPMEEKRLQRKILASEETNKYKRVGL